MHDHVVTNRATYSLLTANVQQQVYFVSHAALKVVTFGLLTAQIWVQSQGVDKSSYSCTVSEYLDMSCDYPIVIHGQKKMAELTGCILKLSVKTFKKFGIFFIYFQIQLATHGPQTHTKLVVYFI